MAWSFCRLLLILIFTAATGIALRAAEKEPVVFDWQQILLEASKNEEGREKLLDLTKAGFYPQYLKHLVNYKIHLGMDDDSNLDKADDKTLYGLYFFGVSGQLRNGLINTVVRKAALKNVYALYLLAQMQQYNFWLPPKPRNTDELLKIPLREKLPEAFFLKAIFSKSSKKRASYAYDAAFIGYVPAIYYLAKSSPELYLRREEYLREASILGLAEAQHDLACFLAGNLRTEVYTSPQTGWGLPNRPENHEIYKFLKLAAFQSHPVACFVLGIPYFSEGKDPDQGIQYCLRGLESGYPVLGDMHLIRFAHNIGLLAIKQNPEAQRYLHKKVVRVPKKALYYSDENFSSIINELRGIEIYYLMLHFKNSTENSSVGFPTMDDKLDFWPNPTVHKSTDHISELVHKYITLLWALDKKPGVCITCIGWAELCNLNLSFGSFACLEPSLVTPFKEFIIDLQTDVSTLSQYLERLLSFHRHFLKIFPNNMDENIDKEISKIQTKLEFLVDTADHVKSNLDEDHGSFKEFVCAYDEATKKWHGDEAGSCLKSMHEVTKARANMIAKHIDEIKKLEKNILELFSQTTEDRNFFFLRHINYPELALPSICGGDGP